MPRNKVLERVKVTAPSGRNPFDDSNVISAHSLAGELNLVLAQPVIAGTKGKISRRCFSRTADLLVPSFHNVTEHFDFFMVPIHSLWRYWNDWKVNINDMKDTNLVPWNANLDEPNLGLPSNVPRLDYLDLVNTAKFIDSSATPSANQARLANDCIKLSEAMGFGECVLPSPSTSITSRVMNTFIPGAYQKCYFEHYRNTAYESNNPYAYNFDWLYQGLGNGLFDLTRSQDRAIVREMFKMRRVNYRNDYFHNIYPALNYVQSSPSGNNWLIPSNIGGFDSFSGYTEKIQSTSGGSVRSMSPVVPNEFGSLSGSMVSVQGIRAAFALDKLMRASAYAPKHVRDQWKALYGVDTVDDPDMRSVKIGSFQSEVAFQEVTNMANDYNAPTVQNSQSRLGALGARGLGGEQKDKFVDFYAKEDSIIIGLHYYLPRAMYDAYGLHPFNIKIAREDFYNKFFENLGLRPFYASYLDGLGNRIFRSATPTPSSAGVVVGWTVPNMEYKIRPDLNYGAFKYLFGQYTYSSGVITFNRSTTDVLSTFVPHNNAVINRGDHAHNYSDLVSADYFKVSPEDLNSVFRVHVPDDHRIGFYQFYGCYRISLLVVAGMSVHGQPSI